MTASPPAPPVKPAAPSQPTPTPKAPPAPPAQPEAERPDYMSALDALVAEPDDVQEAPKTKGKAPPANPDAKKESEEPAPPAKPTEAPADPPKTAPELRKAYETSRTELSAARKEIEALKQSSSAPPKEHPDVKVLSEKLTSEQKRISELESTIANLDYSQSAEFRERYDAPYEDAYKSAWARLKELPKSEGGTLTERELTQLLFSDEEAAYEQIEAMFEGSKKGVAQRLVQKVYDLSEQKGRALRDAKEKAVKRRDEQTATQAQRRSEMLGLWKTENETIATKYPQLFGKDEGDEEGNKVLEGGYGLADQALDFENDMPPEQRVKLLADIRHRAAAFGREVMRSRKLKSEIEKLKEELKQYEKSAPGPGQPETDGGGEEESLLSKLDALVE